MLHFGSFEIRTDILVFAVSIAVLLLQLLLLFKIRHKFLRLIPMALFGILTVGFAAAAIFFEDWDRLGVLILALISAVPFTASVTAILIYALSRLIKRYRTQKSDDKKL